MKNTKLLLLIGIAAFFGCDGQRNSEETDTRSKLEQEHQLEMVSYADSVNRGLMEDTYKGSARRETKENFAGTEITVNYGSPGIRGRVIWNGLVSYDQVWVAGSHWATAVTFSDAVTIQGVEVPAGTYGFFAIPGKETWTLILNREYDMHLAEGYDETNDVVRVEAVPEVAEIPTQRLTYSLEQAEEGRVNFVLSWENISVVMPIVLVGS
jgi:hypothetical protein